MDWEPAGVRHTWENAQPVRSAVAQRHVSGVVHRRAAHPAMDAVADPRGIRALLVDRGPLFGLRTCYQRMPAMPGAASTVWLVTSASCVPKLR